MTKTLRRAMLLAVGVSMVITGAASAAGLVVGSDPRFDWGANWGPGLAKVGETLGEDLVGAEVSADEQTLTFVIKLSVLPTTYAGAGNWPGIPRYIWDFSVNGVHYELDGVFEPELMACLPQGCSTSPMSVRGNCVVSSAGVMTCDELGSVEATFAQGPPATITIPVPRALIGADANSVVAPAHTPFNDYLGGNVIATSLTFSDALYPSDWMTTDAFRVLAASLEPLGVVDAPTGFAAPASPTVPGQTPATCSGSRSLVVRMRLARHDRIRSVRATVDGRRVRAHRFSQRIVVPLRRLAPGRHRVVVRVRTAKQRARTFRRTARTC